VNVTAALLMGGLLTLLEDVLLAVVDTSRLTSQLLVVGTLVLAGLVTYLLLTLALRSREASLLLRLLLRR